MSSYHADGESDVPRDLGISQAISEVQQQYRAPNGGEAIELLMKLSKSLSLGDLLGGTDLLRCVLLQGIDADVLALVAGQSPPFVSDISRHTQREAPRVLDE
jgi:hypothetical protein